jgi:hypothetical protein
MAMRQSHNPINAVYNKWKMKGHFIDLFEVTEGMGQAQAAAGLALFALNVDPFLLLHGISNSW